MRTPSDVKAEADLPKMQQVDRNQTACCSVIATFDPRCTAYQHTKPGIHQLPSQIDYQHSALRGVRGHSDKYATGHFPRSAMCVQSLDDSRGFAIRITYRISLRSSSLWEPRHPSLKLVKLHFVMVLCSDQPDTTPFSDEKKSTCSRHFTLHGLLSPLALRGRRAE